LISGKATKRHNTARRREMLEVGIGLLVVGLYYVQNELGKIRKLLEKRNGKEDK